MLALCKVVRLRIGGRDIRKLILVSLLERTLYFICESYGIKWTSASFSGAVIALIPVAAMALGAIFLKEKPTLLQTLSMLCSIAEMCIRDRYNGDVFLPQTTGKCDEKESTCAPSGERMAVTGCKPPAEELSLIHI